MSAPSSPSFSFPLLWTIGFSGKRLLPPGSGKKIATAIDQALLFCLEKARAQHSELTAVSSIARGADVLFAQACGKAGTDIPWKCLLPFSKGPFLEWDLQDAPAELDLGQLRKLAEDCIAKASPRRLQVMNLPQDFDVKDEMQRATAYQECGYRIVDESDVMITVLRNDEILKVKAAVERRKELDQKRRDAWAEGKNMDVAELNAALLRDQVDCLKGGSVAITLYAFAAKHPCILLDADADDPWATRFILNDPTQREDRGKWFCDPSVTPVLTEALAAPEPPKLEANPCDHEKKEVRAHAGPDTPDRRRVWMLMNYLSQFAGKNQKVTQNGLKNMLLLHLIATALAALLATSLGLSHEQFEHWKKTLVIVVIVLALLATLKPVLAYWAKRIEEHLEHRHQRESWLHARVLSELCRGMWAMWQLPEQPLDAADEEDFPKLKRLLRTLRLMREQDAGAAVVADNQETHIQETSQEANMRCGAENYIRLRLHDQARYYGDATAAGVARLNKNMRLYHWSLNGTIFIGLLLALHKWQLVLTQPHHSAHGDPWTDLWQWGEWLVIIGPSLATYALARITVLDCRRRARRYDEMQWFLLRLADTLRDCTSNSSRLRLIEHAERMMIEEQHEWFSTTRNFSV